MDSQSPIAFNGDSPLHVAVRQGQIEDVRTILIQQQVDVNVLNSKHETPLHLACSKGDSVIIQLLIAFGADPYVKDCNSNTAYMSIISHNIGVLMDGLLNHCTIWINGPTSTSSSDNLLHAAVRLGELEHVQRILEQHFDSVNEVNSLNETPLHIACALGHKQIVYLLMSNGADMYTRDCCNNAPIHRAVSKGHLDIMNSLIINFLCDPKLKGYQGRTLLHFACGVGNVDLVNTLIEKYGISPMATDAVNQTPLHIAASHDQEEVVCLLITKYNHPVECKKKSSFTPLHLACFCGHLNTVITLLTKHSADLEACCDDGSKPIHQAAIGRHIDIVQMLILEFSCSPHMKSAYGHTILHYACNSGCTELSKFLIKECPSLIHSTDDYGDSPLHFSSYFGQAGCVRLLLFDYHAPIFIRNKAGKTALDLAQDESIKKIFKEYMSSEHKSIQQEYEKLQTLSLKKYAGSQIITRVFVLGNPESGKSTLIESLKRKGIISSFFAVTKADVPPHTAGIVPSICQSKETGRLLYYDFAGDGEYYSSHGAILEMVSRSTVGANVYVIVANLTKDGMTLCNEIGYWLTFISYHAMNMDSQHTLKVVVVLSHSDCLTLADSTNSLNSIKQYLRNQKDHCNTQKLDIIDILSSECRRPRSSQVIEDTLHQISRDTPPYDISFEASLLHGLFQKDFGNVIACELQDLLTHIKVTGIYLPTVAKELYPLVKELHEIGVLMMIGQDKGQLEDYFLLLNPSSLTNEVHKQLFSDSARQKFSSSVSPYYANMGILPERYLTNILPEHITKDCLIQLQYCQEFCRAEVGLNYLVTPDDAINDHLLYFPALCRLESEQSDWATDPKLTFSIGWYTKCTGKFDYFPARYLHVVLLRLAFVFALPYTNCNTTESSEVSIHNRCCTMWKNGIRWLMEEGVECIFGIVNDNKGIVINTKSEEHSKEWAIILSKIIDKAMQAKAEFCDSVSLRHFLLNSNDIFLSCMRISSLQ